MDDEYIRLVLAKINDIVESGKSLPCEWNYDKPGGYSSNIEEDKALSFLNNTGVIDLEPLEAERTIPVFCQKDDGSLGYKSKIIRTHSGSRQIKTNGIHYNLLQLANKEYKLPSNIKKVAELRLSSDKKIAYIVVDKHRYLIKGFRKTSGTKRQVFLDAYKSDEKPIYVGTYEDSKVGSYKNNFLQLFRGNLWQGPLALFMDIEAQTMSVKHKIIVNGLQLEIIERLPRI